jgi:hypothetical protein
MHKILASFLQQQHDAAMRLAAESDLLDLMALDIPAQRYVARFGCTGLVRGDDGTIGEANEFHVGVWMPDSYLSEIEPLRIVTWLGPSNAFHPQIRPPFMCIGRLGAGTPLVDILFQVWEVITYRKVTMREDDALNPDACVWARRNMQRFPVDPRPLKRRTTDFTVEPLEGTR